MKETDIKKLYGVGSARAAAYARLGVYTVEDLLEHYPRGYEDRGNVRLLCEADGQGKSAHILTVATEPKSFRLRDRSMSYLKLKAYDDSAACEITFFNQDYLKSVFSVGSTFRFYGKVELRGRQYVMSSPAFEPILDGTELPPLVPIYPLTEGLSGKQIAKDMRAALMLHSHREEDPLPEELRRRLGLCLRSYALRSIHVPDSFAALAAAKKRLIFEEFFTFALGLSMSGSKSASVPAYPCNRASLDPLTDRLPYRLTGAQRRVIEEIRADMAKDSAMNRMVVGDVGSGKTVCAAAAMLFAVQSGRQAVLMAPTEILARQHHADLSELFAPLGIECALLVGSMTASEKKRVHRGLAEADPEKRIPIVIGTQALLSEGVETYAPGLVVADEQHRFGVNQRATLAERNRMSHMLVMSATPIPRTLALSLYGDLDVSLVDEMPVGRQRVDTFVVDEGYRARLDAFIRKQVGEGGQVYIVCPAVDASEDEEVDLSMEDIDGEGNLRRRAPLRSAVAYTDELRLRLPELSVEFLHGKMKAKDKERVMGEFASGNVQVLVSTTVIEVGVNVPNACLMIVENADRFGLSQLHQLRGRVGRGARKSYCVLVSDAPSESDARRRLQVMRTCYDGYEIAEQDLELRGPGDFLRSGSDASLRQSGDIRFRLATLCDDTGLMKTAFAEARSLVESDPSLGQYPLLLHRVKSLFSLDHGASLLRN